VLSPMSYPDKGVFVIQKRLIYTGEISMISEYQSTALGAEDAQCQRCRGFLVGDIFFVLDVPIPTMMFSVRCITCGWSIALGEMAGGYKRCFASN